jgi:hypothetical protein
MTTTKETAMFTCPTCRKQYQSRQGLRNHLAKACRFSLPPIALSTPVPTGKREIPTGRKPQILIGSNRAGLRIDVAALEAAIADLGITRDVEIKWTAGYRRVGTCSLRNNKIVITCSATRGSGPATETLWHELTHAKQMEGYTNLAGFMAEYKRHGYTAGAYHRNPYEVEARRVAEQKSIVCPLVRR